jgi:hypothetical protein
MPSTQAVRRARGLAPLLAVALAALAASGCDDMTGPGPIPSGGYAYTGFDSSGVVVVTGWLTLDLRDPARVTGEWRLEPVGNPQNIGPQTGEGRLQGAMADGMLQVDLNPGSADNNVLLDGTLAGNAFRGRWMYSGFAGVLNEGSFEALRR